MSRFTYFYQGMRHPLSSPLLLFTRALALDPLKTVFLPTSDKKKGKKKYQRYFCGLVDSFVFFIFSTRK